MTLSALRLAVVALAGLLAGALLALAVLPTARERLLPAGNVKISGEALVGGPFTLTDPTGRTVTDQDFRGCSMLVVFGAVASPETTSAALQVLSAALAGLGPKAERAVPVLVVVDGEHAPPEQLARLTENFHPRPVALTGTTAQIGAVLAAYRVPGIRMGDDAASAGRYRILDAPPIYVMGPDGRYRGHVSYLAGAKAVARSLAGML